MSTTYDALTCACACQDAQRLVNEIKAGTALPDSLHVALQAVRATGNGYQLRAFTRVVQKAIETPSRIGE